MTESGMSKRCRVGGELGRVGADRDQVQRQVADDLGRRGHLDDVAEDPVGRGVHVLDLLELLAEAQRDRLLAQVGELAAGDLVGVDAAGRRGQPGLERRVEPADRLPVRLERADGRRGPGRSRAGSGRSRRRGRTADGWQVVPAIEAVAASTASTPASIAASRVASWPPGVSWVCRCTGRSNSRRSAVTRVRAAGARSSPAMSLIARTCAPDVDDALGEPEVVVERVEPLARVGQVAGVAERDLGDRRARRQHRLDGRPHLLDVVERVEDAEHVHAGGRGLVDERLRDVGGVRRVADGVAPAQQHLQAEVRHRLAQRGEPLPRVLGEEPQRHVVRRPAPGLERPQLRGEPGDVPGDGDQVTGAHPGGEQRLVRVAEGRVGDGDPVLGAQRACERRGAQGQQRLAGAVGRGDRQVHVRQLGDRVEAHRRRAVRLVDRHVGEVGEQLGAAVAAGPRGQQLRVGLDERRRDVAGVEVRVVEQRLQEGDVGGDAADPELRQRPAGPLDRLVEGRGRGRSAWPASSRSAR